MKARPAVLGVRLRKSGDDWGGSIPIVVGRAKGRVRVSVGAGSDVVSYGVQVGNIGCTGGTIRGTAGGTEAIEDWLRQRLGVRR